MSAHPANNVEKPARGTHPAGAQQGQVGPDPELQGEGNHAAARRHRHSVERFVASGRVEQAARDAAPDSPEQARDLRAAEEAGRARARK